MALVRTLCIALLAGFLAVASSAAFAMPPPEQPLITYIGRGDLQLAVEFSPPGDDGGSPITSYTVTAQPGGAFITSLEGPFTFTGLTIGVAYTFTVIATNADGDSPPSNPSDPVIAATLPGVPTAVSATAGNGSASISFTPPAFDGGAPVGYYVVTTQPGGETTNGSSSPIQRTGLTNGVAYTFTVAAANDIGIGPQSAASSPVTPTAVTPGIPKARARAGNAQAIVDVTVASDGGSPITLYTVTSAPDGIVASGTTSPVIVGGLTNGVLYTFTATVTNAIGTSAPSAASHTVRPSPPGAPSSPLAYVPAQAGDGVFVIDTATHEVITRVVVGNTPGGVAISRTGNRAYVTNFSSNSVYAIDTVAQAQVAIIPVQSGPSGIAVNPAGTRVYVTNTNSGSVSVIDTSTNSVIASVPVGASPFGIVVSPNGERVYVAVAGLGRLKAIDTASNTVVTTGAFLGVPVVGVDVDAAGAFLYVTDFNGNGVLQVNAATLSLQATAGSGAGQGIGIATAPNGYAYATRALANQVAVIGGNTVVTTIAVGTAPKAVSVTPNGAHVYVVNEGSNNVSVIQASDWTVIATIPVGATPSGLGRFVGPAAAPRAPTSPSAAIHPINTNQVLVSFTAPSYDGGMPITSYTVTSSPSGITASGTTSPVSITGLVNGTPYTFTVAATNVAGTGSSSPATNAVTVLGAPPAPTNVVATAGNGEITITFEPPPNDGGFPITQYIVQCMPGSFVQGVFDLEITITGLTNGVQYSCTVSAVNSAGQGTLSAVVTATPAVPPVTLSVSLTGAGLGVVSSSPSGISCGGTCAAPFAVNATVTLTATPVAGATFRGWGDACPGTGTCQVVMSSAKNVIARFDPASTPQSADLGITQTANPNPARTGKDLVFTLVVTNHGPGAASGVTVVNAIPPDATYVWTSPGCAYGSGLVACQAASLAAGASVAFKVVMRPLGDGPFANNASVTAVQSDPLSGNNSSGSLVTVNSTPAGTPVFRYRLYSPVTLEHHFTTDLNEYTVLGGNGNWVQEGTVGKVLNNPGSFAGVAAIPYYRLYDNGTQWHHWTTDANEYYTLIEFPNWSAENVDGYILPTQPAGAVPLYRLLYPFVPGLHHWTIDPVEYNALITTYGWIGEGGSGFVVQ